MRGGGGIGFDGEGNHRCLFVISLVERTCLITVKSHFQASPSRKRILKLGEGQRDNDAMAVSDTSSKGRPCNNWYMWGADFESLWEDKNDEWVLCWNNELNQDQLIWPLAIGFMNLKSLRSDPFKNPRFVVGSFWLFETLVWMWSFLACVYRWIYCGQFASLTRGLILYNGWFNISRCDKGCISF